MPVQATSITLRLRLRTKASAMNPFATTTPWGL